MRACGLDVDIHLFIRSSSEKGRTVDALAPGADEGRSKRRKASDSRKQADPEIPEWGNPTGVKSCDSLVNI